MADTIVYLDGIPLKAVDNIDGTFSLATTAQVDVNNVTLGAVKILDEGGITEAAVGAPSGIDETSHVLGVHAPVLGLTTDAKVITDATGTIQQYLRGLVYLLAGYLFSNIATQTTTPVKSGAGLLKSIVVNTPLALGSIVIYDNTAGSGTKIATITFPATLLSSGPITVTYNAQFSTGLTIVTSGASVDLTVSYR